MEEKMEECPVCGKIKDDVEERPNHYDRDVNGNYESTMVCCADCEENNAWDI